MSEHFSSDPSALDLWVEARAKAEAAGYLETETGMNESSTSEQPKAMNHRAVLNQQIALLVRRNEVAERGAQDATICENAKTIAELMRCAKDIDRL